MPWLEAVADSTLPPEPPPVSGVAAGVVLAAPGYPDRPQIGTPIEGLDAADDVLVFHAGTRRDGTGRTVTAGGRVLTVVGLGETLSQATSKAYGTPLRFEGMQRRGDIGRGVPSPPSPLFPRGRGGESRARIAVLASGEGSNLQALLDASRRGEVEAEIAAVLSHRAGAGALRRAEAAGIPALALPLISVRDAGARTRLEERLISELIRLDIDLVVLAGWMLVLSPRFLERCPCPILNVHPALLPNDVEPLDVPVLRGAHAVRDAIALSLPYTGVSVHYVTEVVDAGPVIVREVVPVTPDDDEASLYRRIKPVEHRLLVAAVRQVLAEIRDSHSIDMTRGGVHA
jgi:phosphoribosylglycinamide formyltransferase-1